MTGISETTKINYIWKKLIGKQNSSNAKRWYEELDGQLTNIHKSEVWIDKILENPMDNDINTVENMEQFELSMDKTVSNNLTWRALDNNTPLISWIPPSYGNGFNIKVYIDGVQIPSSHPVGWYFDYTNGILKFENSPPSGSITISGYRYTGQTFETYLDAEQDTISKGILGIDEPELNYIIQHNMNSYDIDAIIYTWDKVGDTEFWKRDIIPLILLDENRLQIQLTEAQPIRFIVKCYDAITKS